YQNSGAGAGTSSRVTWEGYKVITSATEAQAFAPGNFIAGSSWLGSTSFPFSLAWVTLVGELLGRLLLSLSSELSRLASLLTNFLDRSVAALSSLLVGLRQASPLVFAHLAGL
ncbi:hypothetical protein D5086_001462, partial [Populus alba]